MSEPKSILVVHPGALEAELRAAMAEAGVLVVEAANPDDVRLLMPEPTALSGSDMVYAAVSVIAEASNSSHVAHFFVNRLASLMKANREADKLAKNPTIKQPMRGPGGRFVKAQGASS